MKKPGFKLTKYTCYYTYLALSSIFALPPLLFLSFKELYGISYTLLGTLVLTNFCTQFLVDMVFTAFSKHFNIKTVIRLIPLLTTIGLVIFALAPYIFPSHVYLGLLIGTITFSIASGLCEVFLTPLVAAIPSDNKERDMSTLHSLYAYGFVTVVIVSSIFFKLFGTENWTYLTLFWALLPMVSFVLYNIAPIPDVNTSAEKTTPDRAKKRRFGILLCMVCIFLGSAAENTMSNWVSSFVESALHLPKTVGDILGMCSFAILLGLGRTLYAKYGKNITRVLLCGMIGATVCYLIAGISPVPVVSLIACMIMGFCTSLLWPGTLIMMEENFPNPGVTAYALMAAGGDLGASVAPQMLGIVVDKVTVSQWAISLAPTLSITPEQLGMKVGMLCAMIFPFMGIFLVLFIRKKFKKEKPSPLA